MLTAGAVSDQLQAISFHIESAHRLQLCSKCRRVDASGYVHHLAAAQAACMMMWICAPVIACRSITVCQFGRQSTTDQRLQRLVNRRERNVWYVMANSCEYFVRGWMRGRAHQETINSSALFSESLAVRFQRFTQHDFGVRVQLNCLHL